MLRDLVADLVGSLQPSEVTRRILARGRLLVDADRATLSRITPTHIVVEATVGTGGDVRWIGTPYTLDHLRRQAPAWEAVTEGRIVLGGPLEPDAALPPFREALTGVRHTASIPLVHEGRAIGLLVLSRAADIPFGGVDAELLETLGDIASIALRNADAYEAERTAALRRAAVLAAAEDIASQTEVAEVIQRVLQRVVDVTRADQASLLRIEGRISIIEATTGSMPVGARYPSAPALLRAIDDGHPARISAGEYVATFPRARAAVADYSTFLIVPLTVARENVGVIALARTADAPFDDDDVVAARQLAPLASLLVRNARLLDRAVAADHARQEFMNIAVHQMRAPLGVVRGYVELLRAGGAADPAAVAEVLATVDLKAAELAMTVDDLLAAARLESGGVSLSTTEVELGAAVEAAVARAAPHAALAGGSVVGEAAPGLTVVADADWLARILDNLVNNAIAYATRPPEVRIVAGAAGGRAAIRVVDNGRGIDGADRDLVFGRFTRLATGVPGSGLGLYIARGAARLMGGDLRLESSTPGQGSVFRLDLPLKPATAAGRRPPRPAEPDACPHGRPFPELFTACPAYQPSRFVALGMQLDPVATVWTCTHLEPARGSASRGGFYASCRVGDEEARIAWANRLSARRLAALRPFQIELGRATEELAKEMWAAKARQVAAGAADQPAAAETVALRDAGSRLLAVTDRLLTANATLLTSLGFPVEACRALFEEIVGKWVAAPGLEVPTVSAEALARFPEEVRTLLLPGVGGDDAAGG